MAKRVLCLLANAFEEIEAIAPVDLLRRAGAEVVMASLGEERRVTGRNGITVEADTTLQAVMTESFDLLLLPGGPAVAALRADGRAARLAQEFHGAGKHIAAICAAPTVLGDAGLLNERRFTAHFSVHAELPAAAGDERVVSDGQVITSRGAGTAIDFGLALVARLYGDAAAQEIACSIMA